MLKLELESLRHIHCELKNWAQAFEPVPRLIPPLPQVLKIGEDPKLRHLDNGLAGPSLGIQGLSGKTLGFLWVSSRHQEFTQLCYLTNILEY